LKDKKLHGIIYSEACYFDPILLLGAVMIVRKPAHVVAGIAGSRRLTWVRGIARALTCPDGVSPLAFSLLTVQGGSSEQ
jgi:hypothetical protein